MSDFVPIPGHPGYSISSMGEVRLENCKHPMLLVHDARGRVRLRDSRGKRQAYYVGEILAMAGLIRDASEPPLRTALEETRADLAAARAEAKKLRIELDTGRIDMEKLRSALNVGREDLARARADNDRLLMEANSPAAGEMRSVKSAFENLHLPVPWMDIEDADPARRLPLARRLNGHLMAAVEALTARIEDLEKAAPKGKRGRKPGRPDFAAADPLDFFDELPVG
jgi:hypothetical protein